MGKGARRDVRLTHREMRCGISTQLSYCPPFACTFTHSILLSCLTFCLNVYLLSVVPLTTQPPAYIQPCVSKTIKMSKHTPYSSHDQMSPPSPGHVDFLSEMSSWKSRQKQMGITFTSTWRTNWLTLSPFFFLTN